MHRNRIHLWPLGWNLGRYRGSPPKFEPDIDKKKFIRPTETSTHLASHSLTGRHCLNKHQLFQDIGCRTNKNGCRGKDNEKSSKEKQQHNSTQNPLNTNRPMVYQMLSIRKDVCCCTLSNQGGPGYSGSQQLRGSKEHGLRTVTRLGTRCSKLACLCLY